ncbi:TraB/GumN family protein [Tissierella sp. MSJ-40]|uniref:TraB/GumN family protein n=1 Tax=Tissierella simiarum TaxID=2841534 RepID=A0ABS6EB90_9FIRM|nr:TraB/GumN family protein [Tissierella simiarum]MBU5440052.1 TraB/GumN family protein [Tissierella simiarum]
MRRLSKKILLLLVVTVVFSNFNFTFAENEQSLPVESPSNWAVEDLMNAQIQKLGREEHFSKFKENMTREELAELGVILYEKLSDKEITPAPSDSFKDTQNTNVLKALALNLVKGERDLFNPNKNVTREEVAIVIYDILDKYEAKIELKNEGTLNYKDIKNISEPSLDKIKAIVLNGIMDGKSSNKLGLEDSCTREEALALFSRAYDFVMHKTDKDSKGFLWEISNGKNNIYVLGSVHVADSSIYPFSKDIIDNFNKADVLAVEANIFNDEEGIKYMAEKAVYTNGDALEKNISKETYELFVKKIKDEGLDPKQFEKMKPWYAALLIQGISMIKSSLDATLGIDYNLMNKAVLRNKDIAEIEGIKFQTDLFDNMSLELQESFLLSSLVESKEDNKNSDIQGEAVKYMLDTWKKGDMKEFEEFINEINQGNTQDEFNKKFLDERNKNMAEKIQYYLNNEDGKNYFVVIGSAHLIGDTGIIKILKEKGYNVRQIINKNIGASSNNSRFSIWKIK